MRPLCIYHANCADGFASAWVVRKFFNGEVDFHAAEYGKPLPPNVFDRDVYVVDFSYSAEGTELLGRHAKSVTILDHHKTAKAALSAYKVADMPMTGYQGVQVVFDMERSGAGITWDYFFPGQPRPVLVNMVEDRDLWRFKLGGSRILHAAMMSYSWDFAEWDRFALVVEEKDQSYSELLAEGAAIERRQAQDIATLLDAGTFTTVIGKTRVHACNLPFMMASDGASQLATKYPFGASYYDTANERVWSLRSRRNDGADVSEIAKLYGGGGHAQAAGFKSKLDWRGDQS